MLQSPFAPEKPHLPSPLLVPFSSLSVVPFYAALDRRKPQTFDFLGLTHMCARSRTGKFTVHVKTMSKRLRRGLKAIAAWCQEHRHDPVLEQRKALNAKLRGHYQYYGRPANYRSIDQFYRSVRPYLALVARSPHTRPPAAVGTLRSDPAQYPLLPPRIMYAWRSATSTT